MNLAASLEGAAARDPGREALVQGDLRLAYAQLRENAARLAGGLEQLGLRRTIRGRLDASAPDGIRLHA